MTVLEEIDSLTSDPSIDFDLSPNLLEEFPEYKNVFKYLNTKPMDVFLTYRLGDKPNQIYYFDLSSQKAQEKYLDLLKQDNVSFDTLKKELSYVELDRFPHNFKDAENLETCLRNGDLTPEQCQEDFMQDYNFTNDNAKTFYDLTKLKSILKNYLVEIEDEDNNSISFSFKSGNGYIFTFEFNEETDIYNQFHDFAINLDYDEIYAGIYDIEASYEDEADKYNCEKLTKGYIESIKNIDQELKNTLVKQDSQTFTKSRIR